MVMGDGKETGSRLSLAYQSLQAMPPKIVAQKGKIIEELDLTNNKIHDYKFLIDMPRIKTLILDHNSINSHMKFPVLPELTTLWLNHNRISNLGVFIGTLAKSCPKLKFLSMMDNEAAPSFFNGGSYMQYVDYRHYVISHLPTLELLDHTAVSREEREEAERIYGKHLTAEQLQKRRSSKKSQKKPSASAKLENIS